MTYFWHCRCKKCGKEFGSYPRRNKNREKVYPQYCSRECFREYRGNVARAKAKPAETLVRVPALFYCDHDDRGCEPFCEPVRQSSRFVWLRPNDPGLPELLNDAESYADEFGPDAIGDGGGIKRSAVATVKAIRKALPTLAAT